jgi:hypothetical protein
MEAGGGDGGSCPPASGPGPAPGAPGPCAYTDDATFCACLGMKDAEGGSTPFDCGGVDAPDNMGINHAAYCGACPTGQYCKPDSIGDGFGRCAPGSVVQYDYQMQKITMLVSLGEGDSPQFMYGSASNIGDGRGYTISTIGFTTGTGDFIFVAACYNDAEPNNVLKKYWGNRDSSGRALNGLIYYNDVYNQTQLNQCDTSLVDSLGACTPIPGLTCFEQDLLTASMDPKFTACEDSMTASFYLAPAALHAKVRGFEGALTVGFLYDTEINFGDTDDPSGTPGAQTIMSRADADYGSGLPSSFAGLPWEESRWLGFFIKERTIAMSKDMTWMQDMDQDATWEAARRLNTAMTNSPESGTNLSMDYDFNSVYKAGATNSGAANITTNACPGATALTPCWGDPPLQSNWDTCSTTYTVSTDKTASPTDPAMWGAKTNQGGSYGSCPANPTP